MTSALGTAGEALLVAVVLLGVVPVLAGTYQVLLAGLHGLRNHYAQCRPVYPRTAVVVPAWNEAAVVGESIDRLLALDYPPEALRIYVVDDASTDETPQLVRARASAHPGRVVLLRRAHGGEGKAHTLNHGLAAVLADTWPEAVLIMDADVIYPPAALRRLTRHLADPRVGAVTAYITEGSRPGNYVTRFIGFEYITAQAAARRGQMAIGALACLAGGAQLHSRANLVALGGRIDTSTLAEDTVTTFETQLAGRLAIFDPHVRVVAEEPGTLAALWKQRLRWARGNVQVTWRYRRLWFRRRRAHGLGGFSFGLLWFGVLLQPVFMILATMGLIALFFVNPQLSYQAFQGIWIITALCYLVVIMMALMIDPVVGRHCWRQAVAYPGLISLVLITYALFPQLFSGPGADLLGRLGAHPGPDASRAVVLFIYLWLTMSMLLAWSAARLESRPGGRWLSPILLYLAGYGSLLCAVMVAGYLKELRRDELTWEKTEKTGKVAGP